MNEKENPESLGKEKPRETPSDYDSLKSLGEQFSDPSLKSSARILILFSLALNTKLGFGDLLSLTGSGKGSLSNHLEKLEASGYVTTRSVMTFGGPRVEVRLTEKGKAVYKNLVKTLGKLGR